MLTVSIIISLISISKEDIYKYLLIPKDNKVNISSLGIVNWTEGYVASFAEAKGVTVFHEAEVLLLLKEEARKNILELCMELPIDEAKTVKDLIDISSDFKIELVQSVHKNAFTYATAFKDGKNIIALRYNLFGKGSFFDVLKTLNLFSETPDPWRQARSTKYYKTALIIDVRGIKSFKPSILPRIIDTKGRVIYSPYLFVKYGGDENQYVKYVTDEFIAYKFEIVGAKPFFIAALTAIGKYGNSIIISEEDADVLLASLHTIENISKGHVFILVK